jgi:hypothetical protein
MEFYIGLKVIMERGTDRPTDRKQGDTISLTVQNN